jgi:PAS domain S-box-containing protein
LVGDPASPTTCVHAETGADAIPLYRTVRPAGVVVSTWLPDIDGWTFLAQLEHEHGEVAAVVIGERDDERCGGQPLRPTRYAYLARRNATKAAVRRAVRQVIERHALEQQVAQMQAELAVQRQALAMLGTREADSGASAKHQQAENARRQHEREYATLVDNVPDSIARLDRNFRFVFVSPAVERATGLPPAVFLGRTNQEVGMPDEVCKEWDQHLTDVFAAGKETQLEFNVLAPDGLHYYETTFIPERNNAGMIETALTITRDISFQKRSEQSLRFLDEVSTTLGASLRFDETLHQVVALAVPAIADQCAIHLREDDGSLKCYGEEGLPSSTKCGWLDAYIAANGPMILGPANVMRTSESELVRDTEVSTAEDTAQMLALLLQHGVRSTMTVPLKIGSRLLGTLSFAITSSERRFDATDLHLAEELARRAAVAIENARLYHTAQEAVRERDAFLMVAAHEVKNPLTTLLGHAQLLERRARRSDEASERDHYDIKMIIEQTRRAAALLNDLENASLFESGLLRFAHDPVDLVALIGRIVASVRPALSGFTLHMSGVSEPVMVRGDSARLEQVFHNLIANAVKYSPQGGTITIDLSRQGQVACIEISDTGIGIPLAAIPHLFKRFFRVQTDETEHIPGSGLGLYVVKEIVTQHGGTVTVVSTEGQCSTFSVELPLFTGGVTPPHTSVPRFVNDR